MLDHDRYRSVAGVAFLASASLLFFYYLVLEDRRLNVYFTEDEFKRRRSENSSKGYLVFNRNCRMQDVDPFDPEVVPFVKAVHYMPCTRDPLLTTVVKRNETHSDIVVNSSAANAYSKNGVTCCYQTVKRSLSAKKPDDTISISSCIPFQKSVSITDDFTIVKCATKNRHKPIYKNAHAAVNVREEVRQHLNKAVKSRKFRPLPVLLIGIDSISRLNALRTMPRTINYLRSLGWIEMQGYNKIGDNTYPNLMAILTGLEGDSTYQACLPTVPGRLENCSFIWTKYHNNGYVTAYAEDEATISSFNFHKVGFVKPPTDYYLRPLVLASQHELKTVLVDSLKYCVGPVSAGERILHYAQEFANTFKNDSHFGLFWTNSFSHNDLNFPSGMDKTFVSFFRQMHDSGVMNSSMIVFFSDHGMRFGDVRQTKIGWFEERLPFFWVNLPEWWTKAYPKETAAFKMNTNRLTTPYDLHMTFQHILELATGTEPVQSTGCPKCHSLFKPIDPERSCEDAAISPHWCVCTEFRSTSITSDIVKNSATFVVSRIAGYIKEHKSEKKCAHLSLNRILIAQKGFSPDGKITYYLLFLETLPGRGKFEATVSVDLDEKSDTKFKLHSSISRLDAYSGQSSCIDDAFLKKYCYCR